MHSPLLARNRPSPTMRLFKSAFPSFFLAALALMSALGPTEARAQLRDSPQSSTRPAPPVQDSLSVEVRKSIPPLRPAPGRNPFQHPSVQPPSGSGWAARWVPLSPARPEDLSAAQNLLWGTVGLTLTAFFESSAPRHQAAWSRRTTWSRHRPRRTVPPPRPRGLHSPPRHQGRDPVRRRSMEALVEGLFNVGSYTKLR